MRTTPLLFIATSLALAGGVSAQTAPSDGGASPVDASAPAPPGARERFAGATFVYAGDASERAAIESAIEYGIDDFNFITRPIARGRLRDTTRPYPSLRFSFENGRIEVAAPGYHTFSTPGDGTAAAWVNLEGDTTSLTQRIASANRILQAISTDQGGRNNVFILSPDNRALTVRPTVHSPRLTHSIVFTLTYRR